MDIRQYLAVLLLSGTVAAAQDIPVEDRLHALSAQFEEAVIPVTAGVYTAVGYGVQPVTMIEGDDGLVIVDTGIDTSSAERVLAEFRKISDKPVRAIVYTHGHADHTGGTAVFRGSDTQIWGRSNFGAEQSIPDAAGVTISRARGGRQSGMLLPPEQVINLGVGRNYRPVFDGGVPNYADVAGNVPTHTFAGARKVLRISGIDLELVAAPGETDDQLYVWLPQQRVLFSGDNFYHSWPNLYAIRGTTYRDIKAWAASLDAMLREGPQYLVPGHTRPVIGKDQVTEVLETYRDAVSLVFSKTIEGMNLGLTPDQLVEYVQLPPRYANKDYLQPYYGHPDWAVRSIFSYYLGWFDGRAASLFPLSPEQQSLRMVELAGGEQPLRDKLDHAMASADYQWALQLADHLLVLAPDNSELILLKADILTALAEHTLNTTARNYYLTVAQELRMKAP
jgi:alkyl sulfatase BDS1-like metallo-beta-lactamase superfamily hydrolase